jgi:hypothetical protein
MFDLFSGLTRTCDGVSRRSLLKIGSLGGLMSLPVWLSGRAALAKEHPVAKENLAPPRDVNCIFIWTHGGTSHHDTLDPKPEAPPAVKGPFGVIDTAIPGIKFSEICPRLAQEAGRFALLRGWNPMNGSHGTADAWCMSGRKFNPALTYPCYGAVISEERGFKSALPPFVQLGTDLDRRFGGGVSGILGLEHMPFEINSDPNNKDFTVRDISLPKGIEAGRIERRSNVLAAIDSLQRRADLQPTEFGALDENYKAAFNMLTAPETKRAFQIEQEDPRLRDRYGRTRFGQNLLLARRLVESGVRFVTVTDPGWDTHAGNFDALQKTRVPPVDAGLPELLIDLEEKGLLDTTLVVWMTDFGRTPKINSASGRDHWASAGFVVMAGAGIPNGVLGATDNQGERPTRNEYTTDDVAATIYTKLGLPLDLVVQAPDGRPVRLIEGHAIREWV